MDLGTLVKLFEALQAQGVAYVLVGGIAMNLHGIVRATEDVDLFIRADEENVGRLRTALRQVWDDPSIEEIRAADVAEYAVVRYGPPAEAFVVDVIARIGTAIQWEDLRAQEIAFEGCALNVATPETLWRMKKGTMRPIDQADALSLREKFGVGES